MTAYREPPPGMPSVEEVKEREAEQWGSGFAYPTPLWKMDAPDLRSPRRWETRRVVFIWIAVALIAAGLIAGFSLQW